MPSDPSSPTGSWLAFLERRGARVEAGHAASFGDARQEAAAARDGAILANLSHNAVLGIAGDDATAFLHGQFTNDVESLAAGAAQWNGWCSAKGRLLATFLLLRRADGYLLVLPAEIAPAIAKRLRMYVLRSKVRIDEAPGLVPMGLAGPEAAAAVAASFGAAPQPMRSVDRDGATCIALDDRRFVILAPAAQAPALWESLAAAATEAGTDAWDWSSIQAGVPTIVAATQESFVPQMANFELVGGVSFRKGCYPGQEIVARTQYRGILKRRMALAHTDMEARPAPGQSVFSAAFGDQAAGEIANAAPAPGGGWDVLVVAQLDSLRNDDLRIGASDGARLRVVSHPAAEDAA